MGSWSSPTSCEGSQPPRAPEKLPPHIKARLERFLTDLETDARDLLFQQEIKDTVQRAYAAITGGAGETMARQLSSDQELAEVPGAVQWARGGQPRPLCPAPARPGGAGCRLGGIDTILAARRSDPRAVPSAWTCWRRCASAAGPRRPGRRRGLDRVPAGEMEDIPLPDESVDVAISHGVLNLSARKSQALAEIFRVLRPGVGSAWPI